MLPRLRCGGPNQPICSCDRAATNAHSAGPTSFTRMRSSFVLPRPLRFAAGCACLASGALAADSDATVIPAPTDTAAAEAPAKEAGTDAA